MDDRRKPLLLLLDGGLNKGKEGRRERGRDRRVERMVIRIMRL